MEFDDADGITHPSVQIWNSDQQKKLYSDKTPAPEVILVMPN
jgi:hypothetical protein